MGVIPARYVLSLLGFFGFFNVYSMRINLTVAIVAMVKEHHVATNETRTNIEGTCTELLEHSPYNDTRLQKNPLSSKGEFDWDSTVQGQVLGSFFYGYIITQVPGGVLAEKYGAKWLYGIGMLVTSILTLLTPLAARWSVWALVVARVVEGLGEGVTFPAMNALIGRWAPKLERSRMSAYIYAGAPIGTVVTLALSGVLCDSDFLGGWPAVFYVFGALGCVWFILWVWLIYESPETHPRISKEEFLHIRRCQDRGMPAEFPVPWKDILTSVPVWALTIAHTGKNWGYYTLLIQLPTYLSNILYFDLKQNGVLSSAPHLALTIASIVSSIVADKIRSGGRLKVTTIRKLFNSISFFGSALCLLIVTFIGCRPFLIVGVLTLSTGMFGFANSGYSVTHVDMSPDLAGTLYGFSNCFANCCGFLVPAYVGWIIQDGQTVERWSVIFITSSVVLIVSGIIYDMFASAELQKWGRVSLSRVDTCDVNEAEMALTPMKGAGDLKPNTC